MHYSPMVNTAPPPEDSLEMRTAHSTQQLVMRDPRKKPGMAAKQPDHLPVNLTVTPVTANADRGPRTIQWS